MYEKIKELVKQHKNIFITGSGGVGKSYNIRNIQKDFKCVLTSSTGVSALNINGTTVHSWSGVGTFEKDALSIYYELANQPEKLRAIQDTRRLIIDEISMIDAYGLDLIDEVLKLAIYGKDYELTQYKESIEPFGGIQVILVGDFFQLPPVNLNKQSEIKWNNKKIDYCFNSRVWKELNLVPILLTKVKRQSDKSFIETLQRIRTGDESLADVMLIHTRTTNKEDITDDVTKLYFTNKEVDAENQKQLDKIDALPRTFTAYDCVNLGAIEGFQPVDTAKMNKAMKTRYESFKKDCRVPTVLNVKVGARVMLLSNYKFELGLCNGSCGYVVDIAERYITVKFDNGVKTEIEREKFEVGDGVRKWFTRKQFPLRLAYAITVHKSQGMTLDKAYIDFGRGAFAEGQAYVALSRVKSLEGLYVSNFSGASLKASDSVYKFYQELEKNPLTITE